MKYLIVLAAVAATGCTGFYGHANNCDTFCGSRGGVKTFVYMPIPNTPSFGSNCTCNDDSTFDMNVGNVQHQVLK